MFENQKHNNNIRVKNQWKDVTGKNSISASIHFDIEGYDFKLYKICFNRKSQSNKSSQSNASKMTRIWDSFKILILQTRHPKSQTENWRNCSSVILIFCAFAQ